MEKFDTEQPMGFHYEGFKLVNSTPVPDDVFDVIAPQLEEGELRVLLYIIRRTFGFKKQADNISLRQLVDGIRKKDGEVLDRGAGVSKSTAVRAIRGLTEKGIVVASRNSSPERGDEPTTYALRFQEASSPPVFHHRTRGESRHRTPPCSTVEHPRVSPRNPQHDREQHDREQQHAPAPTPPLKPTGHASVGLTDALTGVPAPLLSGLLEMGFQSDTLNQIFRNHPAHVVNDWLHALPYVSNAKDPAAFLVQALKKNWSLPAAYLQARKKAERAKEKAAARDAEERARLAHEKALQDRLVKVDAYLALLDDSARHVLETEAVQRVLNNSGGHWKAATVPAVLVRSEVRAIAAERMGLPPLDDERLPVPRGAQ